MRVQAADDGDGTFLERTKLQFRFKYFSSRPDLLDGSKEEYALVGAVHLIQPLRRTVADHGQFIGVLREGEQQVLNTADQVSFRRVPGRDNVGDRLTKFRKCRIELIGQFRATLLALIRARVPGHARLECRLERSAEGGQIWTVVHPARLAPTSARYRS